jgi:hypothetical protein
MRAAAVGAEAGEALAQIAPRDESVEGAPGGEGAVVAATDGVLVGLSGRHLEAERRIELECAPRLRALIEPRGEHENPHDYIARYWASPYLQQQFSNDLMRAVFDDD